MKTAAIVFASSLLVQALIAQSAVPAFTSYPAPTTPIKTAHKVLLQSAQSRHYATALREAAIHPPDFAGHYILATVGCGASCVLVAAIDAQTGIVVWLPFTVCCWPMDVSEPLEYKSDSRLLVVHGSRNEKGTGTYYYVLDPAVRSFLPVRTSR